MNNQDAVRYPVGFKYRHLCLCSFEETDDGSFNPTVPLDYVQSRKKIYVKEYCRLVKKHKIFKMLQDKLKSGVNLLIVEVDGPHQESMNYYRNEYGVQDDFIQNDTILINEENIKLMLNDTKHAFGHGYCLSMALLDKELEWNE